jgi:DNA-binding protein H-NS
MATTLEAIQAKIKKLQAQADALMTKKSAAVLKTIHELMEKHGLTTADIDAHAGGKQRATKAVAKTMSKGSAAAVKYRDPKSGATWSGHGRAPSWIAAAKNRDKFLVDGSTSKPASGSKAKAAGNYVRGPQPAMYQDPTSGATWSGRGRAPAWIAEANDRSKFLIASGADSASAASVSTTASKVKTAVRKATAGVGAGAHKGQRKGPQPAKYLDPKTGATWSGRGPAPAWLAAAKDRTRFLIAGVVSKKAVAKKVAAKKAIAKKAAPAGKTVSANTLASGAGSTT